MLSLSDDEINVNLPQFRFYSRAGDMISLAGMALLTEKNIWEAIKGAEIDYYDWVARKEDQDGKIYLHIFIELKSPKNIDIDQLKSKISDNLKNINPDFGSFESLLGYDPLKLDILNPGAFGVYMDYQKSEGADLAHTKPPHMKPTSDQMSKLLKGSRLKD